MQAQNIENITEKIDTPKVPASIVFVMDASGSMLSMGDEPIQGLNSFYKTQKESGEFTSTLVFFNSVVTFHHQNINGKDVPSLTNDDYHRDGMTALYDAIGMSIEYQKNIKTENVIVVILTDGLENASREYKRSTIKTLITKMEEKHKWTFVYLGANQDAFAVSQGLGIRHSAGYEYSEAGCAEIFRTVSESISRCVSQDVPIGEFKSAEIKTSDVTIDTGLQTIPEDNFPDFLRRC